ncbi:MAG: copper amine oxidase N-terminal domain-containing protein [Firmicutes bacterium]|nr:copper amine oxidase N-terminal domain-containing protein [Bacillota bacterium]
MKIKLCAVFLILIFVVTVCPLVFALGEDETPTLATLPYYGEFSGKVVSLKVESANSMLALLENEEGTQASFVVDEVTFMLTENELKEGATATGYYLNSQPNALIYPPRYQAMLMAVDIEEGHFIKAARFDDELISDDKTLKLNIGEDTEILLFGGEAAPADLNLGSLRLAVYYGITTRSIPAITTPQRIIVLALTDAMPLPVTITTETTSAKDGMPLVVEHKQLKDAPPVYLRADGIVMVPLRAVAEALGHKVGWEKPVVLLDGNPLLSIGEYESELTKGHTYVPLHFYKELLGMKENMVASGQVEINNGGIVE